jgi:hypothetical protein
MNHDGGEYLKIPPIPDSQMEALSRGDLLWQDSQTKIFYPENPLVAASEGLHLRVESADIPVHPKSHSEWAGWLQHWGKMVGAAKVVAEGADVPDLWQSLVGVSEFTPKDHMVSDIIFRNPHGSSWTAQGLETAPLPDPGYDNRDRRVEAPVVAHLGRVMDRYFKTDWLPQMDTMTILPDGLTVHPPGSKEFDFVFNRNTKLDWPDMSEPLLVADKAEVIAILVPHLKTGIHLMLGVPDSPKRPWHNLTRVLESFAIAEASGQVLGSAGYEGLPLAADWSIRATDSWYGGFKDVYGDPVLHDAIFNDLVPAKWIKRRQRGVETILDKDKSRHLWTMGTLGFHPHLYVARYPDELIRLARRPAKERGADWEGIIVMDSGKRGAMRDALNEQLPKMIDIIKGPLSASH